MPLECNTPVSFIQQPNQGLTFPDDSLLELPFTLQGAPMSIRPQPFTNLQQIVRKPSATKNISNLESYFASDNYYTIPIASQHIIGPDSNTVLRYSNIAFSHQFTCLHKNLWLSIGPLQLSILFQSSSKEFFHLCIPIEFQSNSQFENEYLAQWLYPNPPKIPEKFGVNYILNFKDNKDNIRFSTIQYCFKAEGNPTSYPYVFCLFKNSLKLNQNSIPEWLKNDLQFKLPGTIPPPGQSGSYRPKLFSEIFNLNFRGTVTGKYIGNSQDPYEVSNRNFFDGENTQTSSFPSYYKVSVDQLLGTFKNVAAPKGSRGLKNVKCFPLNMASQIDDQGNIIIDQQTNKPIDLKDIDPTKFDTVDPSLAYAKRLDAEKQSKNTIFYITLAIVGLLVLILLIVLVIKLFKGVPSIGSTVTEGGLQALSATAVVKGASEGGLFGGLASTISSALSSGTKKGEYEELSSRTSTENSTDPKLTSRANAESRTSTISRTTTVNSTESNLPEIASQTPAITPAAPPINARIPPAASSASSSPLPPPLPAAPPPIPVRGSRFSAKVAPLTAQQANLQKRQEVYRNISNFIRKEEEGATNQRTIEQRIAEVEQIGKKANIISKQTQEHAQIEAQTQVNAARREIRRAAQALQKKK